MRYKIFSIRDRATDTFAQPFYMASTGAAIRAFGDEINKKGESQLSAHPEDFDLYLLGEFDDNDGEFICERKAEQVAIGKDLVR